MLNVLRSNHKALAALFATIAVLFLILVAVLAVKGYALRPGDVGGFVVVVNNTTHDDAKFNMSSIQSVNYPSVVVSSPVAVVSASPVPSHRTPPMPPAIPTVRPLVS